MVKGNSLVKFTSEVRFWLGQVKLTCNFALVPGKIACKIERILPERPRDVGHVAAHWLRWRPWQWTCPSGRARRTRAVRRSCASHAHPSLMVCLSADHWRGGEQAEVRLRAASRQAGLAAKFTSKLENTSIRGPRMPQSATFAATSAQGASCWCRSRRAAFVGRVGRVGCRPLMNCPG